jgi:hypothetical protein
MSISNLPYGYSRLFVSYEYDLPNLSSILVSSLTLIKRGSFISGFQTDELSKQFNAFNGLKPPNKEQGVNIEELIASLS